MTYQIQKMLHTVFHVVTQLVKDKDSTKTR